MSVLPAKKKEAFAAAVAAGATFADAYRQTRDCAKMQASTVRANAKKLAREPAVKARIEELRRGESVGVRESSAPVEATEASGLTPKQERFCELYVEKSNASEAYREAYDVGSDTKPETIHRKAAEVLANGKVTARIEAIRAELRERSAITLDHLVEALRPIAFSDIRKVCDWGPAIPLKDPETGEVVVVQDVIVRPRADLDDAAAAMIARLIRNKDGGFRVELHDKMAAIEKIAKLLGLLKEQHDVKVEDITPRPQRPSDEAWAEDVRRFRQAYREYNARALAEAEAEKARAIPAGKSSGAASGDGGH